MVLESLAPKVLIVDDDPAIREALAECVASMGFEVATASDGQEGLGHLRAARIPAAVLVGLGPRKPVGYSFLAAMRRDRRAAGIPVISLCSEQEAPRGISCHRLDKPFDLDEIAKALLRILSATEGGSPGATCAA